ncbi:MAG: threonine synthase, partial [Acidobacteriota bacterium]
SHLECSVPCGAGPYDPRQVHQVCACGAPLLARYDLTAAKKWTKASLAGREPSMWRYREIMPLVESDKGVEAPVTIGEGWTPLLRARRIGRTLGLERLYIKDESQNPTNSCKVRGLSAASTRALHLGARMLSMPTAGNGGTALAACAARAGLEAKIFIPRDARVAFARECELYGAEVTQVDGTITDATTESAAQAAAHGWYDLAPFREPYRVEGKKTIAYEVAEQLAWQLPDWIIYPTGGGTGIVGLWKAFGEMAALGWIDPVRRPHLVAVQAAGCAPIVRAFASGAPRAAPWDQAQTIADDLRVSATLGDALVLKAVRESGGAAISVGDAEMMAGMRDLARVEGLSASPEGGATLHALRMLTAEARIKAHDTVVVVNTAGAFKYLDLFEPRQ